MKIGINARYLQNRQTGIENYLLNLLLNLIRIDRQNEYLLFLGSHRPVPPVVSNLGFKFDIPAMPTDSQLFKLLWAHFYLSRSLTKNRVDVFHEPSFIAPFAKKCPTVITIYDLAFLHVPDCYTWRTKLYLEGLLAKSIRKADAIITISESSKKDILEKFPAAAGKIKVVYGAVGDNFQPLHDDQMLERVKAKYGIRKDFILNVSLITPRKNLNRLIRAFKSLRENKKTDCQLVIVGAKGWLYEDIFREVSRLGLEGEVVFCNYVAHDELLCLYTSALLFAYPSLYEGFGLPILEAMACDCPVVSADVSSMPEVCGQAALLVDPYDTEGLAAAMLKLISDLALRGQLIELGREQIKKFLWKKSAEQTLEVYKQTASSLVRA